MMVCERNRAVGRIIFAIDDERNLVVLKMGEVKLEFLKSSIAARVDK